MALKKMMFFLMGVVFCWSVTSHALSCSAESASHLSQKVVAAEACCDSSLEDVHSTDGHPQKDSTHCDLHCCHNHFFVSVTKDASILESSDVASTFSYQFLYQQPDLGFEPIPPIQA